MTVTHSFSAAKTTGSLAIARQLWLTLPKLSRGPILTMRQHYHNLAIFEAALGQLDSAFHHIEQALNLNPRYPGFLRVRGEIQAELGQIVEAKSSLQKAIEEAGEQEEHRGDKEEAQRVLMELETTGTASPTGRGVCAHSPTPHSL